MESSVSTCTPFYMWSLFAAASLFYLFGAYIAYDVAIKASPWFLPIGIVVGIVSNLIWLYVTKITTDNKDLFVYGLIWDVMMMAAYILVPLLLFHVKLDWKQTVGTILVVLGLILTKL